MLAEIVTLFQAVYLPEATTSSPVGPRMVTAFNGELAALGYTAGPDLMAALGQLCEDDLLDVRRTTLALLMKVIGATHSYTTLFAKFPYERVDDHDYLLRRILGGFQNALGQPAGNHQVLTCGHVVDRSLFDLADFNACPICQQRVPELSGAGEKRYDFARVTPLKVLRHADNAFLGERATLLLARASSLNQTEKDFLTALRPLIATRQVPVHLPAQAFKENVPFLYTLLRDARIRAYVSGATDALRIASYLSDAKADLSLVQNTKFRIPTRDKKVLLGLLETLPNLAEDLLRHRERWLRLGEKLNPGSGDNRRRFPKTAAAFDALRRDPKGIETYGRKVERAIAQGSLTRPVINLIASRPGDFLRRLDLLLRCGDTQAALDALATACKGATTPRLIEMTKYLAHRKGGQAHRVFIPKGNANYMQVVPDTRARIDASVLDRASVLIRTELVARAATLPPLGAVFIDPSLFQRMLPVNARGDSAASSAFTKGSRIRLAPDCKVVRLFCYWKESATSGRVDVDLSVSLYDESFDDAGHVAFTRLSSPGGEAVHSGDIQSAPDGASEFIDLDLMAFCTKLRPNGARYACVSVIAYTGQPFSDFTCFAGVMQRDKLASGETYEPASVHTRMDIVSGSTSIVPLIVDLQAREIIFADISAGRGAYGAVARDREKFMLLTEAVLSLPARKPSLGDVIALHVAARGTRVDTPEAAERVFGPEVDLDALMQEFSGA